MVHLEGPDGGDIVVDRSNASRDYGSPYVEVPPPPIPCLYFCACPPSLSSPPSPSLCPSSSPRPIRSHKHGKVAPMRECPFREEAAAEHRFFSATFLQRPCSASVGLGSPIWCAVLFPAPS